jgi:hypothetical protein
VLAATTACYLWYDLTEQYHDQLYEMEKADYLDIKRREHVQQMRLQKQAQEPQEEGYLVVFSPLFPLVIK